MSLVHLALRNRALTLLVCTTGVTSLAATAQGYERTTGSFLDENFAAGMEVQPSGFSDTTPRVVKAVTALNLYTTTSPTAEVADVGRELEVGFPSAFARENSDFDIPTDGRGYATEAFEPLRSELDSATLNPGARITKYGNMRFMLFVPANTGFLGLRTTAEALAALYPLGWIVTLADGSKLRTRNDFPAIAGAITNLTTGLAVCVVTIPWRQELIAV